MLKYVCSLIVVNDIERSRYFYEIILGQKIKYDFGENIVFENGFAIHNKKHFENTIHVHNSIDNSETANKFELYFETENLDVIINTLKSFKAEFLHEIEEQPWGQRVFRIYDPDKHIVEIGETMETVALRLFALGYSPAEIAEKSSMPIEFVEEAIKNL